MKSENDRLAGTFDVFLAGYLVGGHMVIRADMAGLGAGGRTLVGRVGIKIVAESLISAIRSLVSWTCSRESLIYSSRSSGVSEAVSINFFCRSAASCCSRSDFRDRADARIR